MKASPQLRKDLKQLQRAMKTLTPEERTCPLNKLHTVNQVAVVALALSVEMQAICEWAQNHNDHAKR